ncbi:MAG TPA: ATP-binding cassette domain-containing protein [Chloroflexota bacterium]
MDISSVDYWANSGASRLHRASALGKGAAALAFVAAVVVTSSPFLLAALYFILLAGIFFSRLPAAKLVSIALYPTVFALFFAASQWNGDLSRTATLLLKALTAAQSMVLLITTTPYPDIFSAVGRVMPAIIADGLFMTYRSFFLLIREMGRVTVALRLRGGLRRGSYLSNAKNLARALGMLLVRAMDLSERLYSVLRIRGYRGRLKTGNRWRSVSWEDAVPLLAGAVALGLALLARMLPGVWASINGFVLVAAGALAVVSLLGSRFAARARPGGEMEMSIDDVARIKQVDRPAGHTPLHDVSDEVARVSCVRHVYPDGTEVSLCGLDFVAMRGERVVILGPNGAGKSTLLNHLLGLLRPTDGEVTVLGHDPAKEFSSIQPKIGVLLQNVDEQLLGPTVADDVAFGARNAGYGEASEKMAQAAMERLHIRHLADKVPHYLSGGEKRKVALAGALVTNPDLLILDEPFEGLDPRSRADLVSLLLSLHGESQMTMIVTTHHVDLLPELADTVYVLAEGGRIVARGTPEEVFAQPDVLKESAIEAPVLTLLFQRLREQGVDLGSPSNVEDAASRLLAAQSPLARRGS